MIYLIYGYQLPVIKKTLKQTIAKCLNGEAIDDFNVERYSLQTTSLQEVVFAAQSLPLTSSHKVVVLDDPYFLDNDGIKPSIDAENDFDSFKEYLNNPSPYTDLIFFLETKSVNQRNEIYKLIKEQGDIITPDVLTEEMLKTMGKALFSKKKASINDDALNELVARCGDDVSKFVNEATKLSLYKDNISLEDVKVMVSQRLEDNVFNLNDALLNGNITHALEVYYDLKVNKQEPIVLISILASQYRFMNQVEYLLHHGYSIDQCADELKCKPYRVKVTMNNLRRITKERLLKIIDNLYQLDIDIKEGNKDPQLGLELFLINFNSI